MREEAWLAQEIRPRPALLADYGPATFQPSVSDGFELLARGAAAAKIAIEPTASGSTCPNDAARIAIEPTASSSTCANDAARISRSAAAVSSSLREDFQVVRVGSRAKRGAASILDEIPSKRLADKCARLYRPATLVALRRGRETYETAALPLSYVGADPE